MTLVYNLVDTETQKYTEQLDTIVPGLGYNLAPLTNAFYDQFEDEVDFIIFLRVRTLGVKDSPRFNDVYRPLCPALGIVSGNTWDMRNYYGSARRLTAVVTAPLVMDAAAPPPHISRELYRNWQARLAGFVQTAPNTYLGWGPNSVNGVAGGFDRTTMKDLNGNPIADPLSIMVGAKFIMNRYLDYTSEVSQNFAPLELWLMGLIGKEEVPPLYHMEPGYSIFLGSIPGTYQFQSNGFSMVTVDDIIAANGGAPPRAASTAFRAAWVLVSETPAAPDVLAKAEQYARIYGGLETHVPAAGKPRWLSFAEATRNKATLDCSLPKRVPALPPQAPPEVLIPGEVTMQTHPNQRFITLTVPQAIFDGWATGKFNQTFSNVAKLTKPLYEKFKDDFDYVMFVLDLDSKPAGQPYGMACAVSNQIQGIGKNISDSCAFYGSSGRLKAHVTLWMRTAMEYGPFLHEICHTWANHALVTEHVNDSTLKGKPEGKGKGGHWGFSGCGGQLGGFDQSTLQENVDGVAGLYSARIGSYSSFGMNNIGGNEMPYSNFELYLMGLIPETEITPFDVFSGIDLNGCLDAAGKWNGKFKATTRTRHNASSIVQLLGPRVPACHASQKKFNSLIVVLTTAPSLSAENQKTIDKMLAQQSYPGDSGNDRTCNFYEATGGRATMSFDLSTSRR